MYCKSCGKEVEEGAKFCSGCGTKTDDIPAEEVKGPAVEASAGMMEQICLECKGKGKSSA